MCGERCCAIWTLFVGTLDNFLRPVLIKQGADLPLLLIFAGVIGGLLSLGLLGNLRRTGRAGRELYVARGMDQRLSERRLTLGSPLAIAARSARVRSRRRARARVLAASPAFPRRKLAWPTQTIRIVVAQAPGGPPDLVARFVAEPLRQALGTPVVVENRPGAGGIVGVDLASRAAPDGYTLLLATLSTHALVPHANSNARYDPVRDFKPVANLFRSVKALWVPAALPVASLKDFVRYASARPGALNFATGGVGSSNHVDAALFASAANARPRPRPLQRAERRHFRGGERRRADDDRLDHHRPAARAGRQGARARRLQRSPLAAHAGRSHRGRAGFEHLDLNAWMGLVAPAATPPAIVQKLHAELDAVLQAPQTARWARDQGLEIARARPPPSGARSRPITSAGEK